jgi:hypothetical protein
MLMINATDREAMQETQEISMMDKGYRLLQSSSKGDHGEPKEAWERDGDEIDCGIEMKSGVERKGTDLTIIEYDATIRIPVGFEINEKDKFEVTEFRGEAYSQIFEIITPVQKGISCNRVRVRRSEI